MSDIKTILGGTKIALEKQASDMFGNAVEDFARGTLGAAVQSALPGGRQGQAASGRQQGNFYAGSYAAALAGGTSYRPKLKFLFKVEFVFTPEAVAQFPAVLGGAHSQDFTFMVKAVDLPKIDFEWEDDVNYYNFRSAGLKKIKHRDLTMTFHDDTGNRVLNFFRALMMIYSPITRRQLLREGGDEAARRAAPDPSTLLTGSGMQFSAVGNLAANDTAIRAVVNSSVGNLIQTIRVKQMYIDPSEQLGNSYKENIYDYINPRLVSFDLDGLSYEESATTGMTFQFAYDLCEIVTVGSMTTPDGPTYNVATPGITGAPVDPSPFGISSGKPMGTNNPFAAIINNQLGRGVGQVTSSAISRAVKNVAGNGRFATALGSQVSNVLGGIVGDATKSASSAIITSVGEGVQSVRASVMQPLEQPARDIQDSARGAVQATGVAISSVVDRFNPFGGR